MVFPKRNAASVSPSEGRQMRGGRSMGFDKVRGRSERNVGIGILEFSMAEVHKRMSDMCQTLDDKDTTL